MDLSYYHLNVLANLIISRYYNNTSCLLIFSENEQIFSYQGPMPSVQIEVSNKNNFDEDIVFNHFGCQGVIIQGENPSLIFKEFEKAIRLNMERFNARRYLLLSNRKNLEVFNMVELNYVVDLLLVVQSKENFDLLTHQYVGNSDSNVPLVLDTWIVANQSFVNGTDLYPDKISNQQGRELKMATFQYEPYSVVIGDSVPIYQGSELSTAFHFGFKHNMTPVLVVNELDYWGEIFSNWSGNGLLGNLVLDNADVGFAALYTWEVCYHYLDLSKPLVRTGITCLVPAPKLAAGWFTPLLSYTPELWIYVGALYGTGTLVLSLIQYFYNCNYFMRKAYHQRRKSLRFIEVFGASAFKIGRCFLIEPLEKTEMPLELNSKFVMVLVLMFSLFLTSTYSGGLESIMTIPRYHGAIRTVDDLVKSGLSWGATQDAWTTSIEEAKESKYVTLVSRFVATSEEDLREYSLGGKFGFPIERLPFENFAIGTYIQKDVIGNFRLMQEDLYWEQCVIMLRKNSVLLPHLDAFILRVFEAGLISKWQSKAVLLSMDMTVQKAVSTYNNHFSEHQLIKLKLTHVAGAFAVLAIGWIISSVIFLCELLDKNKSRK